MKAIDELLNDGTRYCFWLNPAQPSKSNPDRFRVALVFEGERGYRPTGGGDVEPWYWDSETCAEQNAKRLDLTAGDVETILCSSMFPQVGREKLQRHRGHPSRLRNRIAG